jgi:hypothetical protein
MKKVIRLTESDLMKLVKRIIKEEEQSTLTEGLFGFCGGGRCDSNDDGQEIADKILSVVINNPEKVKDLDSKTFGNVNIQYETQYNFKIGSSSEITSRDHGNEKYDLFVGKYKIRCNSSTAKKIFKAVERLDSGSRPNILRSLDM